MAKRKRATLSDLMNDLTYRVVYDKFRLIAVNTFEWILPEGIEERYLESVLFDEGKAVFFTRPESNRPMILKVEDGGQLNVYGYPLWYRAHGFNYQQKLAADQCVIIENNKLRLPTRDFVMVYANKIAEAERTMDVNIKACKTPIVFTCDDKDVLSFKRIFQQVDGNVPAIYADRSMNPDSIQAFQTGVTFLGKELQDYVNGVEGKMLTFLGKNNIAVDKKERVNTLESTANDDLIGSFLVLQYEARQRACDAINEMFPDLPQPVAVRIRQPLPVENNVESGDNNEPISPAV